MFLILASYLDDTALCFLCAAGGAVGPAAVGRQAASIVHLKLRAHKVCVVGETAALQLGEDENVTPSHIRKTAEGRVL